MNYINYTNRDDLIFALKEIEEFTWISEKYKGIFIDDLKYKNKIENIINYIPDTFEELLKIANSNKEIAKVIEDLCYSVYESYYSDLTLLANVAGDKLYVVRGTQSDYEARLETLKEIEKIYLLNPEVNDYTDIFGHNISFHIENEFIK